MNYRDSEPAAADAERRRRLIFLAVWGVVLVAVLVAFHAVMVPFIMAALIAFVLSPIVRRGSAVSLGGRSPPRWVVVVVLYVVMLTSLSIGIRHAAPFLIAEARDFVRDEVPNLRARASEDWIPRLRSISRRLGGRPAHTTPVAAGSDDSPAAQASNNDDGALRIEPHPAGGYRVTLPSAGMTFERDGNERFHIVPGGHGSSDSHGGGPEGMIEQLRTLGAGHTDDIVRVGRGVIGGILGGIFGFFITLMLSAYMLVAEKEILAFGRSLVHPGSRARFDELLHRIDRGLAGVVRGQLIICGLNGVLSAIGFAIAGLPYWPLLALLAAIFSIVPIFGSILSSVPAVAVGLRLGLPTALFTLLWILGIHQLEANLLNPKIMGDAAKINPVLVVFSLLAGEHFFGILGALLAVPTMSITQNVFLHWRKYALNYGDPNIARDSLTPTSLSQPPPQPVIPTLSAPGSAAAIAAPATKLPPP